VPQHDLIRCVICVACSFSTTGAYVVQQTSAITQQSLTAETAHAIHKHTAQRHALNLTKSPGHAS